jgi:cytochrome c-type biogenesis protein
MHSVSYVAAFVAGLLSFVSPCVLPLIPGYLSFVSGLSLEEMRGTSATISAPAARRQIVVSSLAFIVGFSLVFISLGASASALGAFVGRRLPLLGKVAGVVLVLFGLHTMGLFRLRWLESEKRVQTRNRPAGLVGSVLVGIAFAFGWTPCIGPILAGILTIAGAQDTVGQGVKLLAVYSAGLGLPFLLTALAVNQFFAASARIRRYYHAIEVASGALLVAIGVLIFTNQFSIIARYLQNFLPTY